MIRFARSDNDSFEILSLVQITDGHLAGKNFTCSDLDDAEYPYLVQITTDDTPDADFVGLYDLDDLDGDKVDVWNCSWELVSEAPEEVIVQIEQGWASGTSHVVRLVNAATEKQVRS